MMWCRRGCGEVVVEVGSGNGCWGELAANVEAGGLCLPDQGLGPVAMMQRLSEGRCTWG